MKKPSILALMFFAGLALSAPANAAEIKVLTAGAFKSVLIAIVGPFEQATGHKVVLDNDTAGGLVRRISAGESFDLAVITPAAFNNLAAKGQFISGEPATVATVGVGVAVRQGAPKPDISSVENFKQALRQARKIAFIDPAAGGTSGIYLMSLFEKWGMGEDMKAKAVLVPGGLVASRVVSGEADIGLQQISELLAVKGAVVVGPLPAEIQSITTYSVALSAQAKEPEAAKTLMKGLVSPDAAMTIKAKGMVPPF